MRCHPQSLRVKIVSPNQNHGIELVNDRTEIRFLGQGRNNDGNSTRCEYTIHVAGWYDTDSRATFRGNAKVRINPHQWPRSLTHWIPSQKNSSLSSPLAEREDYFFAPRRPSPSSVYLLRPLVTISA